MSETERTPHVSFTMTHADLFSLLDYIDEAIICCDDLGTITFASRGVENLLGYDPAALIGSNVTGFVEESDARAAAEALARWSGRPGSPKGETIRIRAADGSWVAVRYDTVTAFPVTQVGSVVLTLHRLGAVDTQARDLRSRVLNESRIVELTSRFLEVPFDRFEEAIDHALETLASLDWVTRASIWCVDGERSDRAVQRASWTAPVSAPTTPLPARVRIDDYKVLRDLAQGKEIRQVEPWSGTGGHGPEHQIFAESGAVSVLLFPMLTGGEFIGFIFLESTLHNIAYDAAPAATLRAASAIIAQALVRHEAERKLADQARIDRITGLRNRFAFDEALERALARVATGRSSGIGLALLDFDRFKLINDSHGHATGDRLLADVATRLTRATDADTIICRLSGDELMILLDDAPDLDDLDRRLTVVLAALRSPFDADGYPLVLTASVGVVHTTDASVDGGELLRRADVAMFQVKAQGGDGIAVDDPAARDAGAHRFRRESELRHALYDPALASQVIVHYQGEWDLRTNRLVGAEALARWQHPSDGLLTAEDFIPLAAGTSLIDDLGRRVLRAACRDARPWADAVEGFVLRVNVDAHQLRQLDIVEQVGDILADTSLPPECLCLELTESALLVDPAGASTLLSRLRALGVGLAIDDFGTGYSSVLQLKMLPLTSLKVDRSFVSGLPDSPVDLAIVHATIEMARALSMTVTAEGVESDAQRRSLLELGCDRAQGYLMARPEPAAEFNTRIGALVG